MFDVMTLKPLSIVTGHYGVGKTNVVLNFALDLRARGQVVTVVDLDIVNPYFRSSDYQTLLEDAGVAVVAPTFAGTTLDTPVLGPEIAGAIGSKGHVLFDVGGDDAGATALGRYRHQIEALDFDLLYVVNANRNLTRTPDEALCVLREIEVASALGSTGIIGNTHLQSETTCETIEAGVVFAQACAHKAGLPLVCVTIPDNLNCFNLDVAPALLYPTHTYVKPPW